MKRAFFCFVWSVVFFFGSALAFSIAATSAAGDDPAKREAAARESGKTTGPIVLLGSLASAIVLGGAGLLPGTRGRKRSPAQAEAGDTNASAVSRATANTPTVGGTRPSIPYPQQMNQLDYTEHRFTFIGFIDRWKRVMPGIPVIGVIGLIMIGSATSSGPLAALVGLGVFSIPTCLFFHLVGRFLGMRYVRLDATGVCWDGLFGARHREWSEIVEVYRTEKITNRRWRTREIRLKFNRGWPVAFDQALTDFDALADNIQSMTGNMLLPLKLAEIERDGELKFGPVKIRKGDITMKRKIFDWHSLGRYKIENGHLVLYARFRPRTGGDVGVPLSEIPNYLVMLEIMSLNGAPHCTW